MENGSKALIIAGAILLAILIIGLGVYIYNQASNTVSDTGMDQIAIRQFNAQFEPYIMDNASGSIALALYDTVLVNNNTATPDKIVTLNLIRRQSGEQSHLMSYFEENSDVKMIKLVTPQPRPDPIDPPEEADEIGNGITFNKSKLSATSRYNIYVDKASQNENGGLIKIIYIEEI